MLAAMKGYKAVIITNAKCSAEKCASITAYGARLIITPTGVEPLTGKLASSPKFFWE